MDFRKVLECITDSEIPIPQSNRWANAGMVRSRLCDVGWRVIDSQYFGTPIRRKRVFLIADFNAGERCAGEILFEQKDDRGNVETGEREQQTYTKENEGNVDETDEYIIWETHPSDSRVKGPYKICPTLTTREDCVPLVFDPQNNKTVRKLTPLECERLHALPDGWTDVASEYCNDSARYKAIGNGMAQPCADWIIKRIVEEVENENRTG